MFFDARKAKLLKAGEYMAVDGCPGLRLSVGQTKRTWVYRYRATDGGSLKQISFGQWPEMSAASAAAKWQELRIQRGEGLDPAATEKAKKQPAKPPSAPYSVQRLVQDYITGHIEQTRKEDGAQAVRRALEKMLNESPEFASMPAEKVSRSDAFDILDSRKDLPMATAKLKSLLGSAWDYALDAGRIGGDTPNWWRSVMKGRLKSKGKIMGGKHVGKKRRVLTIEEVGILLGWIENMHQTGRDVVIMYLWTCTRGGEILSMRPEQISLKDDVLWWTIPKESTKNERHELAEDLRVPLFGRAREVVERRLKEAHQTGRMFNNAKGDEYTQRDFSTYIYNLQPYSEKVTMRKGDGLVIPVTGWSPHNLRRTGRTILASLGCPVEIAEAIIGHMPTEIVATYNAHSYDAERVEWLSKLSEFLEGLKATSE